MCNVRVKAIFTLGHDFHVGEIGKLSRWAWNYWLP